MDTEIKKLFEELKTHFGAKTYEQIGIVMNRIFLKIESLEKSRDNWREKYEQLKSGK